MLEKPADRLFFGCDEYRPLPGHCLGLVLGVLAAGAAAVVVSLLCHPRVTAHYSPVAWE